MKVRLEYHCRKCGQKELIDEDIDDRETEVFLSWARCHDSCAMHRCKEGYGMKEFVGVEILDG